MRRKNAEERRALMAAEVERFVRQYGRRAQKGVEPNDRRHDRDVQRVIERLSPFEFDRLMRDDE